MNKVPGLYVAAATSQSIGKTAFCVGLALKLQKEGLKVGYFKPLDWQTTLKGGQTIGEDAHLMKHVLKLEEPGDLITPILLEYQYLDQYSPQQTAALLDKIKTAYQKISKGKDLMIMEALHEPCLGSSLNLSAVDLTKRLDSELLFVSTTYRDTAVDEILFTHRHAAQTGTGCAGVVFNRVHKPIDERLKTVVVPTLKKQGVHVWGLIPETIPLTAPSVKELAETLGGKLLCGEENMSNLVERYLIGAMTQESAIRYFRKAPGKAVITGGDRPDIALAALETDTSALILTGDLYPDVRVLARAKEKGIPIILVSYDTFTTVERAHDISGKIKIGDEKRINLAKELVSKHVDWKGLLSCLGLPR
jgi:BioD-like phosphotransacetylase family protein